MTNYFCIYKVLESISTLSDQNGNPPTPYSEFEQLYAVQ